ncbi:hypothetical protein HX017_00250 [Myroides marinus]|uniref:Uncharacterized protein n=1 Tax=Myroides marinus TaxID=703342 RepID=A0A1H6R967_9FLAO|nr:hypothetical protein [Myroides marinus]KUF45357.1 hypothetical protein AS361_06905 [Myroides marinus]MDM1345583.1 hypothetical protein [Myroides marinus]MDM1349172.1 hypothetical protein [Myroides marinus]MDM1352817.1 hypothetical protein [Myroides marinus]MDM1356382.1 hypothetical protein [Myroides marinus]
MEWNKIDKQWKEGLEDREITPSSSAWDKLSSQLDKQVEVKEKSSLKLWIGIAASLLIGGFSVVQFVLPSTDSQAIPTIELPTVNQIERVVVESESTEAITDTISAKQNKTEHINNAIKPMDRVGKQSTTHKQLAKNNMVEDTISTLKPESLKEVFIEPVVNKPSKRIVVSSDDLLNQVEGEIEIEYRESVIKKIYDKTKKVIVERSN